MAIKSPIDPAALGIGLLIVAGGIGAVFYMQRGAHIELKGSVLKVRTQSLDENSSVAVVDFRFVNPSNYPFVVQQVDVTAESADGKTIEGIPAAEMDARRLFENYPALGQKFNDSLLMRDKIGGRQSMDRMIVARFEIPESALAKRKKLTVKILDVDGPSAELEEKR